jgi:vitamin B12 transporter
MQLRAGERGNGEIMNKKSLFTAVAAALVVAPIFSDPAKAADPVIVTATRTAVTADQSLTSVSVITREDIQQRDPADIVDLLRTETGLDIARNGGIGQQTSVFLRGANSNQVLVLVDGVRAASATTGAFAWQNLPLSQIERVEIVRGPRASLYGSDAIGGVIQIFTRRGAGASAAVTIGSYGTHGIEAGYAGGEKVQAGVNVGAVSSDGFSAQNSGGFSFDPDDDGYDNRNVSAFVQGPLAGGHRFELRGWRADGDTEYDVGEIESVNETLAGILSGDITDAWRHKLLLGYAVDESEDKSSFPSQIDTRRRSAEWQNDIELSKEQLFTLGLSWVEETASNRDPTTGITTFSGETTDRAAFAQWQGRFASFDAQLSGRRDDHSSFGDHGTGTAAFGTKLSDATRIWASYGTGFRAPNANELFSPGFFGGLFAGNPNLKPERSRSAEIAIASRPTPAECTRISAFLTRTQDLITFTGTNFQAINVDEASMRGIEVEYALTSDVWRFNAGATFQQAIDETTGDRQLRRPDAKGSLGIARRLGGRVTAGLDLFLSGNREDISATTFSPITLPGYGLLNLSLNAALARDLALELRGENLTDKEYELADGFNQPGRSWYLTLRYAASHN